MLRTTSIRAARSLMVGIGAALLLIFLTPYGRSQGQQAMSVQTSWQGIPQCGGGFVRMVDNPEIHMANVPANTKKLRFQLLHTDAGVDHGVGEFHIVGQWCVPECSR